MKNKDLQKTVVTVGSFDGIHRGHMVLLQRVADVAAQHNLKSMALTFWPHPRRVFEPKDKAPLMLNTPEEKKMLLQQTDVDEAQILPFDKYLSQMTACEFVMKVIKKKYNAQYLIAGKDHNFGKDAGGGMKNLIGINNYHGLQIEIVDLEMLDCTVKFSSSAIREALLNGDLMLANKILGYEYIISGKVTSGNRIGRSIGFPTANIETPDYKLIPKEGVYSVNVKIGSETFYREGMMYIGKRPVLKQNEQKPLVEVHIFDFDQQIYGQEITAALTCRIRNEIQFENIDQLAEQLLRDKEICKNRIANK